MTALVVGAGTGLGLLLLVRGLWPTRVPLAAAIDRLESGALITEEDASHGLAPWMAGLGRTLSEALENAGLPLASGRQDAAIVGKPLERFYLDKVVLSLAGFVGLPAFAAIVALSGTRLPLAAPVWASVVIGAVGFFLPDLLIKGEAAARRRDFRHALGAFL